MAVIGSVVTNLIANNTQFERKLKQSSGSLRKFSSDMRFVSKAMKGFGVLAIGKQLFSTIESSVKRAKELGMPPEVEKSINQATMAVEKMNDAFSMMVVNLTSKLAPVVEAIAGVLVDGAAQDFADSRLNGGRGKSELAVPKDLQAQAGDTKELADLRQRGASLMQEQAEALNNQEFGKARGLGQQVRFIMSRIKDITRDRNFHRFTGQQFAKGVTDDFNKAQNVAEKFTSQSSDAVLDFFGTLSDATGRTLQPFGKGFGVGISDEDKKFRAALRESTMTDQERFEREKKRLGEALASGLINKDLFDRGMAEANEKFGIGKKEEPVARDTRLPQFIEMGTAAAFDAIAKHRMGGGQDQQKLQLDEAKLHTRALRDIELLLREPATVEIS